MISKLEITTKEKILKVALDMFSIKGYNAVSIRDISKTIGIKESSIYYHFTNKKEIFSELLEKAEQLILVMKSAFNKALSLATNVDADAFVKSGIVYIEKFLLEESILKIINLLVLEKQTDEDAAKYYRRILFDIPLKHHEQVFDLLIKKRILKNENPSILALEYQSIILFLFFKFFSTNNLSDENKIAARNELTELLIRFHHRYFKKGETKI